jgi:hypothetical protein
VEGTHITPISILGFFVALGGTTILLLTHRFLGGSSALASLVLPGRKMHHRRATTIVEKV